MFRIRKRHLREGYVETVVECEDPAVAYEKAHEVDAELIGEPFTVEIVDEKGNDMWHYCARMRCSTGAQNEYLNNLEK